MSRSLKKESERRMEELKKVLDAETAAKLPKEVLTKISGGRLGDDWFSKYRYYKSDLPCARCGDALWVCESIEDPNVKYYYCKRCGL